MRNRNTACRAHARTDRTRNGRRGSVIVEFSLAFLAFLTMMMATLDIGRAVWTYGVLTHAVFQGARFATVHGSENPVMNGGQDETAEAIRRVVRSNTVGLESSRVEVSTTYDPNNDPGNEFTLTATYPMNTVFGNFFFSSDRIGMNVRTSGVVLR